MNEETPSREGGEAAVFRGFVSPRTEQLTALLDQVVPALADWCVIDVLDDDGQLSRRAARAADPAKAERVAELLRGPGLDLNAPRGAARAFRTGVPQLCHQLDSAAQGYLGSLRVVRALGAAQCIAVPLSASGTSLGVLSLVRGEGRPPFSLSELAQAEALCRHWLNGAGDDDEGMDGLGARAEELVESTADAFFAIDRRGAVVYMNRRAEVLTGRARGELLGKSIWDAFPQAVGTLFHREYHRTLEDQTPSEYVEFYPPLKAWFEIRTFPSMHGLYAFFRDVTARLKAEEERKHLIESLEAERRQMQEVLQQLPVGVIVRHSDGHLVFANQRMEEILGRPVPEDLTALELRREDGEPVPAAELPTLRVLRTGEAVTEQLMHGKRPGGEELILRAHAGPMRDSQGHVYAAMVVVQDVTERRRSEAALLQSVRRFRSLVEATDAVVWVTDDAGRITEDSPTWLAFTGQSREAHLGEGWNEALHPEDRARVRREWNEAVAQRVPYETEYRVRRRDGTYAHTAQRAAPVVAGDGSVHEWIRSNVDISARKQIEEALRQEREVVETLNRTGAQLAAELDLRKLVQLLTDQATRLSGASFGAFFYGVKDERGQEACRQVAVSGVVPPNNGAPPPRFPKSFPTDAVLRVDDVTGAPWNARVEPFLPVFPSGLLVRSLLALPVRSRSREALGGLLICHPRPGAFTEYHESLLAGLAAQASVALENARLYEAAREAEERAQRAAKLGEEFMGILGHDLRTPIQAVMLSTNLLLTREGLDDFQRNMVQRISKNTARMGRMVSDLLDVTRARLGQGMPVELRPTNFHEVCRRVQEEVEAAHPDRKIRMECHGEPNGRWDADRLGQLLTNLLDNALKYSSEDTPVTLRGWGDDGHVWLEIHNQGKPIPPELIPTLFEPFRRASDGSDRAAKSSLGLGLYIVREILRAHAGDIAVRSTAEDGTTFTVRLPREPGT